MWLIKGCPKCHGDLFEERQLGGSDIACLQCGYTLRAPEITALEDQAEAQRVRRPAAALRQAA